MTCWWAVRAALAALLVALIRPAAAGADSGPNPAWRDPWVQGEISAVFWSDGPSPGEPVAAFTLWSNESDAIVTVLAADPKVRAALVEGRACVGRYVQATGERIGRYKLAARGIEVPNVDPPCRATLAAPSGPPVVVPAAAGPVQPAPGLVLAEPVDLVLRPAELGDPLEQTYLKSGGEAGTLWAEARYDREQGRLDDGAGPLRVVNRVYVTLDLAAAQQVYQAELARQDQVPESGFRLGEAYPPQGISVVGEEQSTVGFCNANCGARAFNGVHLRTVARYQNVVVVLYCYGGIVSATPLRMNDWLATLRGRL